MGGGLGERKARVKLPMKMEKILWAPSRKRVESSSMYRYMKVRGKTNYRELHQWSIENPGEFWRSLFDEYNIIYQGDLNPPVGDLSFRSYAWFPKVELNFAENLLRTKTSSLSLNFQHESGLWRTFSYRQLNKETARFQHFLKEEISMQKGDVLACYMPNIPETVISMLATTALGGVFTSTSSDFGVDSVVDRFGQCHPKVLVAACGYEYGGKYFDLVPKLRELAKCLPSLEKIVAVDFLNKRPDLTGLQEMMVTVVTWEQAMVGQKGDGDGDGDLEVEFERVPFNHPLYIMYSSGTTGKPKCIVHSVGGTLLQHFKELGLHCNVNESKRIFFFTTCGWMMWNWLISSLGLGAEVVLYEGSPKHPDIKTFFEIINREKIHLFGSSPPFLKALEDFFMSCGDESDIEFPSLETVMSTGSPLMPEQFDFLYNKVKRDLQVASISGGTDLISCFMLGNPLLPVIRGAIQCLGLGMDVSCFGPSGEEIFDREGELVCKQSFPSRPLYFLNDRGGARLGEAYFTRFPGVWHHGDFIKLSREGTVTVLGRSDATLNPGGVRIGTAEIYRQTERIPYLSDSLCVGKRESGGKVRVILFVKLQEGEQLTDERIQEIKSKIRKNTTPRHVPQAIHQVARIPYTRSGKKMELAIARLLDNRPVENREAISEPEVLESYKKFVTKNK